MDAAEQTRKFTGQFGFESRLLHSAEMCLRINVHAGSLHGWFILLNRPDPGDFESSGRRRIGMAASRVALRRVATASGT